MTEGLNLMTRLKASKRMYLRNTKNVERSVLNKIGTFSCNKKERVTKVTVLENRLFQKIYKIKEIDLKILNILLQGDSGKEL